MTYQLSSLRLGTDFDRPPGGFVPPGFVTPGISDSLYLVDGVSRAPRHRSRAQRPTGLLGVQLADPSGGVRVRIRFVVDPDATARWAQALPATPSDPTAEEIRGHRLIEVRAQGRPSALVYLSAQADGKTAQTTTFDVDADEFGPSGVLWLSFEGHDPAPQWARNGLLADCLVGVHLARIRIEDLPGKQAPVSVAVGYQRIAGERRRTLTIPGFFAINPGQHTDPLVVELRQAALTAESEKQDGAPPTPHQTVGRLHAHAVSMAGATLFDGHVTVRGPDSASIRIPNPGEPLLLQIRDETDQVSTKQLLVSARAISSDGASG